MADIVVRLRRHHVSAAQAGESVTRAALFALMVAPTVLLWSLAVHLVFFRR